MSDSLEAVLNWVHAYVRRDLEATPEEIEKYIIPNQHLNAATRLAIHREQHWNKTSNAVQSELPNTLRFMGQAAFKVLLDTYLRICPPQAASLIGLKRELPEFLKQVPEFPYQEFIEQLITVEIAIADLYHEPATPCLTVKELPAGKDWLQRPLVAVPGVRLLSLLYRIHDFLQSKDQPTGTERADWALPQPNHLLLVKHEFNVRRYPLTPAAYELLQALVAGHAPAQVAPLEWRGAIPLLRTWIGWGVFASLGPLPKPKPQRPRRSKPKPEAAP